MTKLCYCFVKMISACHFAVRISMQLCQVIFVPGDFLTPDFQVFMTNIPSFYIGTIFYV